MTKNREWWANVYRSDDEAIAGVEWPTRDRCQFEIAPGAQFRIHVRLKPKGAPKRYASEFERDLWNADPEWCRHHARYLPLAVRSPAALLSLVSGEKGCDHGV